MLELKIKYNLRTRILIHVLYWLGILFLLPLFVSRNSQDYFNQLLVFAVSLPFDMAAVYISFYFLIPTFLARKKVLVFLISFVITGIFFVFIQRIFIYYFAFPEEWDSHKFSQDLSGFILVIFIIYGLSLTIKLIKLWYEKNQAFHEIRRNNLEVELKLKEAELSLLRAQLHPHFLFNTLNNLYGLTLVKSDLAPGIVLGISGILDYILHEGNQSVVPLEKEIKHLKDYIKLEQFRFGEELMLEVKEEGDFSNFQIAPLILIPFVENAFKHGVSSQTGKAEILIHIKVKDNKFRFRIENSVEQGSGNGENHHTGGVGLANVRKRLELLYKNRHDLTIEEKSDKFIVALEISG